MRFSKLIPSLFLAGCLSFSLTAPSAAVKAEENGWLYVNTYYGTDGAICAGQVQYTGSDTDITIPTEIEGYPVRKVHAMLVMINLQHNGLNNVTIHVPDGVEIIDYPNDHEQLSYFNGDFKVDFVYSSGDVRTYTNRYTSNSDPYDDDEMWEYEKHIQGIDGVYDDPCIKLLKYNGGSRYIHVPSVVEGLPVVSMGDDMFGGNTDWLQMYVTIPEGIVQFGDHCLGNMHNLYVGMDNVYYQLHKSTDPNEDDYLVLDSTTNKKAVIPETVAGYTVRGINSNSKERRELRSIELPDTIEFFDTEAFLYSEYLQKVNIPKSVELLPSRCFARCNWLEEVDGIENVKFIANDAFDVYQKNLYPQSKVFTPLKRMNDVFSGFLMDDGAGRTFRIRMDENTLSLTAYLIASGDPSAAVPAEFQGLPVKSEISEKLPAAAVALTLPENTDVLSTDCFAVDFESEQEAEEKLFSRRASDYESFYDALQYTLNEPVLSTLRELNILSKNITVAQNGLPYTKVTDLSFPGNAVFEKYALSGTNLRTLSFTGEMPTIIFNEKALYFNTIEELNIPEKVTELKIGDSAFSGNRLKTLTLPEGTAEIGESAFSDSSELKEVVIHDTPKLGDNAFANSPKLENVTIDGVVDLGNSAFANCPSLKNINIDPQSRFRGTNLTGCKALETINGEDVFNKDGSLKQKYKDFFELNMRECDNNVMVDRYVEYRVKKIVSELITDDMTDIQKVKVLHDKVCKMAEYDTINTSAQKNHTDVSIFLNDSSVCEGYSRALNLLLHEAGIPSCYVSTAGHAWNIVRLGDHYFHVDATWDDGIEIGYNWFMKTDSEIKDDPSHTSWKIEQPSDMHSFQWETLPECTDRMGDVTNNGKVDAVDATAILTHYAKASVGKNAPIDEVLADYNFDGKVNAKDATAVLTYYAKSSVDSEDQV